MTLTTLRATAALGLCTALLAAGCAAAPSTPAPAQATPTGAFASGIDRGAKVTQLSASFVTTPEPVAMTDGKVHLTYELVLTNVAPAPVRVDGVELHDAATSALVPGTTGRVDLTPLQVGAEAEGAEGVSQPGPGNTSVTIAPTTTYVAWVDVVFPQRNAVPATIEHVVSGAVLAPGAPPAPIRMRLGRTNPATAGPIVVGAPVPAGTWYMSEGCCADDTHHRRGMEPVNGVLEVPNRYAIDFYKLDDQQRTWVGDPSRLDSYLSYRQPILSATAGTVVAAQDGLANSAEVPNPTNLATVGETVGNHVIVQVSDGVHVLYAHMDPGSVAVRVGDRVTRGQQLGLIGSSGISTTPHLHFQILTTPTYFPADSRPYAFDSFTLLGHVPVRLWDDNLGLQPTGALPFRPANPASARTNELPLDRDVVRFGP
ncbi:M23 family metallopeptidase [Actinomycetospora straminea]|nr:M23 family metallopeptidase [Actinomycetospora straminea]MDD7934591.1 M23 family metallopeptidase [Actinomycetospora straminea]